MGNTLTACTSGNKEDRIPKNNAPTERPAANQSKNDEIKEEPSNEQSSFIKNINIRKSLRAARKSVVKPFKKSKATEVDVGKEEAQTSASATDEAQPNGSITKAEVEVPVLQVDTHSSAEAIDVPATDAPVEVATIDVEVTAEVATIDVEKTVEVGKDEVADTASDKTDVEEKSKEEETNSNNAELVAEKETEAEAEAEGEKESEQDEAEEATDITDGDDSTRKAKENAKIIESLFNKYDKDGSGSLKRSEIKKLLREELGLDREEASIMQLLIDEDDTKDVSLDEFKEFMAKEDNVKIVKDSESYGVLAQVLQWFKQSDTDGSGTLNKDELGNLLQTNLGIPAEQADSILVQFDTTGDQQIGFLELVKSLPATAHLVT